jgi:hypothetical protein
MSEHALAVFVESKTEYQINFQCDNKEFLEKLSDMIKQFRETYKGEIIVKEIGKL